MAEPYNSREILIDVSPESIQFFAQQELSKAAQHDTHLENLLINQDLVTNIIGSIGAKAEGSFLMARLFVDNIVRTQSLEVLEVSDRILPVCVLGFELCALTYPVSS